jgi:outer membrane protein OmpA-like peptidoglycan-associated protein
MTMSKTHLSRLAIALAACGACLAPATGADSARVGAYDFGYAATGDARARPIQVFDDGRSTFFQFRPGESVPAIFTHKSGIPQLLVPSQEGPYIKVANVHGRFVLQVGRAQAAVIHAGATREDAPPMNVVSNTGLTTPYVGGPVPEGGRLVASLAPVDVGGAPDDAVYRNSYATPRKGDAVKWVEAESRREETTVWFPRGSAVLSADARKLLTAAARSVGAQSKVVVIGRDDDTLKEGLDGLRAETLKSALVKVGVDPSRIISRVGVAGTPRGQAWPSTIQIETERPLAVAATSAARATSIRSNLDALVAAGVLKPEQAQAIAVHHGARAAAPLVQQPETVPKGGFTLVATDKTVHGAIKRWAASLNYQVVWDAPAALDAPILGDAAIPASSIQEALERLLGGLKDKGYALDATVFSNRVIRLTATAAVPRPVEASPPAPQQPAQGEPRPSNPRGLATTNQWQMLQGDRTVQAMLARWAADAQWNVVWNAQERIGITGDAVVTHPTFKGAAEHVIAQAAQAGYRLRLTSSDDRTVVVSSY